MISIVVLGMAAGPMIYSPMNLYLIEEIGWKWLFVLYGSIYAIILIPLFALFYRDSPFSKRLKESKSTVSMESTLEGDRRPVQSAFSIFRYPVTWIICLTYFICGFTDIGLINTHLAPFGEDRGYSGSLIGNALFLYGVTNILGTVVIGYITDKFNINKILGLLFSIRIIALLLLIFTSDPVLLLVFALLYGLTDIATIAPFTMLCSKIFGIKQMGSAFGMISFFHQFGAAVGSFIPRLLFSLSSDYLSTLWICVIILCLNVVILLKLKENSNSENLILSEGKMLDK